MQSDSKPLSLTARLILASAMAAAGLVPMLAAFDVGLLSSRDINGPPWLGAVAGGIFMLGGAMVLAGERARNHPLSYLAVIAVIAGFAAVGNWIAFGHGPRACGVSLSTGWFVSERAAGEMVCRAGFGIGALVLNGMLVWVLASSLRRIMGPGPVLDRVEKAGQVCLLIGLTPVLLPVLALLMLKSLFAALAHYFQTGTWPRNEAFIERMKRRQAEK